MYRKVLKNSSHNRKTQQTAPKRRVDNIKFGNENHGTEIGVISASKTFVNSRDRRKYEGSNIFYGKFA